MDSDVDIAAIALAHPVNERTCTIDLAMLDVSRLTLLEVLDMSEAVGVEPAELSGLVRGKSSAKRMRMLFALAWVIARRAEPELTFDVVCTWRLSVVGVMPDHSSAASRAALTVGAAKLAGVTPDEAEGMTMAELGAYADIARRARRKVG